MVWGKVPPREFKVSPGEGFRVIVRNLQQEGFIRSSSILTLYGTITGAIPVLKPGLYTLAPSMSGPRILALLATGARSAVQVTIPEGSSLYEVDKILSDAGVLESNRLLAYAGARHLEGYLFPDTYKFFLGASVEEVVQKFLAAFALKAKPLLQKDQAHAQGNLILASLLEREVTDSVDARVVAGILKKRLAAGMPLQVDATICYIKKIIAEASTDCYPLSPLDFTIDSPYNTYLRAGLPSEPIGSPGVSAITAVLNPRSSQYWYYLSDPKTGKTVFSQTLDEQEENRIKYLKTQ